MLALLWVVYFASSAVGYVGMKWAADSVRQPLAISLAPFFTMWGIIALVAWMISALVWPWILARTTLHWANCFSSFRVLTVSVAAALFLAEPLTIGRIVGVSLITAGVILAK